MVLAMSFLRPAPVLAAVLAAAGVVAGCGGADAPPSDPALQTYFDGIATQTVASLRGAAAAAAPGSPAAAYATYLEASSQAASDGGHPVAPGKQVAERTSRGYEFCQGSGSQKTCYEYTGITRDGGKVSDFSVNKHPITDRLALGSGRSVAFRGLHAHATFIAAYETTASDNLLVAVRIKAGPGTRLRGGGAADPAPEGHAAGRPAP